MARYIDADAVEKRIADYYDAQLRSFPSSRGKEKLLLLGGINYGRNVVRDAPTADVVEVVRCEKCKHCDFYYPVKPIDGEAIGAYFCKVLERYTNPTNFCRYGERKEK